ncbi:MAG: dinitrogenase iron-molybdenum cofactor biosynthesis protein [Chitinivibrionales bacterium]|nr:dinitrogenase iron-molybdenum cofactor biosynthesis protein [Chitinivibrionales bacterium]MBD3396432.1 dinitrogenase iron-molybdenum cofactor biosynthesis protein [Chitinivibrionales bacterium]
MKVAVTAKGTNSDAEVDSRFGRARGFVVIDTETGQEGPLENTQNLNAMQGAGIQAAQNVISHGVEAVVTGHCGPKAFTTLRAGDVRVFVGASGTVKEALALLESGELKEAEVADVEGEW